MPTFLSDLGEDELADVVLHPEQLRAVGAIANLIAELRSAKNDPARLYDMEAALFRARYRADEAWMGTRRALVRIERKGKDADFPRPQPRDVIDFVAPPWQSTCAPDSRDPGEWRQQERVAERISRQLAVVGDALAWRVFRYDRRLLLALASHPPTGPFVDSAGLPHEVGAILESRERGNFALMHDLTSVIRHVDMTEVHPSGYRELREIKASAHRKTSSQRTAAHAALDAATGTTAVPYSTTERYIRRANVQLRTTVRDLADQVAIATRDGTFIGYHADRVITIVDLHFIARHSTNRTVEAGISRHIDLLDRRWPDAPRFNANTSDKAARDPVLAPYSIYPLQPEICARLVCDQMAIAITISFDAIRRRLSRPGAQVRTVPNAPTTGPLDGGAPIIEIRHLDRRLQIPMSAITQLLLEFIDTKRWADAVWELLDTADTKHPVLTFMNERAVWA